VVIYTALKGCLEAIGFNDAKEELINEIVGSLEIELLHEKTFDIIPGMIRQGECDSPGSKAEVLRFKSDESKYCLDILIDWKS
jgi:hypothetical protein